VAPALAFNLRRVAMLFWAQNKENGAPDDLTRRFIV